MGSTELWLVSMDDVGAAKAVLRWACVCVLLGAPKRQSDLICSSHG